MCFCGDPECWFCGPLQGCDDEEYCEWDDDFIPTGAEDAAGGIVSDADPGL